MRKQHRLVLAAVAVAAIAPGPAHADVIGAGAGTGIKDWLVDVKYVNNHGARGYCEYAVNATASGARYGHFEAGGNAWTGGTFDGSPDVVAVDVTCKFENTATGTFYLGDSSTTPTASATRDQALGGPRRLCLTARFEWSNGDVIVMNKCQAGGSVGVKWEAVDVAIGVDDRTAGTIGRAPNAADGCANGVATSLAECTKGITGYAGEVAASATGDQTPSAWIEATSGSGVRDTSGATR